MASRLVVALVAVQMVSLAASITSEERAGGNPEGAGDQPEEAADDLDTQETGWLIDEKLRKLEYLKNKVIYPFSALKSPSFGGGGVYPVYGGGKPPPSYSYGGGVTPGVSYGGGVSSGVSYGGGVSSGVSYGGGVSSSPSYGASFRPSVSYGASARPSISYGASFSPSYSVGGGSHGFFPSYKQKFPYFSGGGYAPSYPVQQFQNNWNFKEKFNPTGFKQFFPTFPQKPLYSSGSSGGFYKPAVTSYAPYCKYYVYRPSPSFVQPTVVYTTGTPLSSYYPGAGPTQTFGGGGSAKISGSAEVSLVSVLPSADLRINSPVPYSPQPAPPLPVSSGYIPPYSSIPNAPGYYLSAPSPPTAIDGSYFPSAPAAPQAPALTPSYPDALSNGTGYSAPLPPGSSLYVPYALPAYVAGSSSDQSPGLVFPQVRDASTLPGATTYPGAVYFSDGQSSSDGSAESQPTQASGTDDSPAAPSEAPEPSLAASPPPPTAPPAAPVLTTYYYSNTVDRTRVPYYFYIQPVSRGFYSSPAGYAYSPPSTSAGLPQAVQTSQGQ